MIRLCRLYNGICGAAIAVVAAAIVVDMFKDGQLTTMPFELQLINASVIRSMHTIVRPHLIGSRLEREGERKRMQ